MSLKWLNSLIVIKCPECHNDVSVDLADFDIDVYSEDNGENKMGDTYRHTLRPEIVCPHCNANIEGEIEFIEYPIGHFECVNCSGEGFKNLNENDFSGAVDFSIE